jgi:ABC-2 type transport system permease protein
MSRQRLVNILQLGVKELHSFRRDPVMLGLIIWAFTFAIYSAAHGVSHELRHAAVAIVDEDRSTLSERIRDAIMPPEFVPPALTSFTALDRGMDTGRYTFGIVAPRDFQADMLAGRDPTIQVNVDATAMMQAGIGAGYLQNIIARQVRDFASKAEGTAALPVRLETRVAFNPNLDSARFTSIMQLIQHVTMLSIILAGAALIREREHGTIEHLLAMPLAPFEIVIAKIWANALVVFLAVALSLWLVVHELLAVPIAGSAALFLFGVAIYLFSSTAVGIVLATIARSMPQLGLLFILTVQPLNLLSGGFSPVESQPLLLRSIMSVVPSTRFVSFAQAILYRGAGLDVVWPDFAAIVVAGIVLCAIALVRFRRAIAATG